MLCPDLKRFTSKFSIRENGCWEWDAHVMWSGYGLFWAEGKTRRAHRWAYGKLIGPIPEGLHLDHLCKSKTCVNPQHLEPVTPAENMRRTQKEACIYGHPKTGKNLYIAPKSRQRQCRECHRIRQSGYQKMRKETSLVV